MVASVRSTKTSSTTETDNKLEMPLTISYKMRVADSDGNLSISFSEHSIDSDDRIHALNISDQAKVMSYMSSLMPSYKVSTKGNFIAVADLPSFQAQLHKIFDDMKIPKTETLKGMNDFIAYLTSEIGAQAIVKIEWNNLVGSWNENQIKLGKAYKVSGKLPMPILENALINVTQTFSANQKIPCNRKNIEYTCIELERNMSFDQDEMKRALEITASKMVTELAKGKTLSSFRVISFDSGQTLKLLTELDGLVPHKYQITTWTKMTVEEDGVIKNKESHGTTEVEYSYP